MKIAPVQIENYINRIASEKISGCLIFGHDEALISYYFDKIAKKIYPDLSDPFLVTNITKDRLAQDKSVLHEEFYSFSMLGGRKLILVKDCDNAAIAGLKDIFSSKDFAVNNENFILINGGNMDKGSALRKICEDSPSLAAIACYEDDERVIKKFINDYLIAKSIKFNAEVTNALFEKFGKNRQNIISELDKIIIFLGEEKSLSLEVVDRLTSSQAEITANEFVMNFAARNFEVAILQAEKLLREGFEPIVLIRFLSNYLQKICQAKMRIELQKSDFEEVVKAQKLFFKTEAEFRKHLKLLSLDFLIKKLRLLENLEIKIKSSHVMPKLLFVAFIQDCQQEKNLSLENK